MTSQNTLGTSARAARDKRAAACPRELSIYSSVTDPGRAGDLVAALADLAPLHWDPYVAAWLVCGHDEVRTALTDDRFSSYRSAYARGEPAPAGQVDLNAVAARMLLLKDGAEHLRLKKVVQVVLSPRRIKALEPHMRRLAGRLLPAGGGRVDFAGFARRFPLLVAAELLGIPEDDLPVVAAGSDAMTEIVGGLHPTTDPDVHRRARALHDYALAMVRDRRERPRDDGAGAFVAAAEEAGFTEADIAANLVMLIASAHQTMPGLLTLTLRDALARPDEPLPTVARALAHATPSRFVGRIVTDEVELDGRLLVPGDAVVVLLAAANRGLDPARPARHLSFGHGRHRCAGAAMAELEAAVVFDRLAEVRPAAVPGEPAPLNDDVNLPALTSLPVTLPEPHRTTDQEDVHRGQP